MRRVQRLSGCIRLPVPVRADRENVYELRVINSAQGET